ncbi:MAG: MFS transporter, partial [Pseudomonadota bacterium]
PMAVLGIVIMGSGVVGWFISLPLIALNAGYSESQASFALVVAMLAAAISQYPIGWLSDRIDRRYVVIGLSLVSVLAALWMAIDTDPSRIFVGYAVIAAVTLPVYSILAAHANDQLSPAQIIPASGTMAFLLQLGQFFGMLIAPNLVRLADGRGLQIMLILVGLTVAMIAITRRVRSEAPEETGEFQAMGILGVAQPGMLQAEVMLDEDLAEADRSVEESSTDRH